MLTSRGLGRVLGDLAKMGFDAKWGVLGANSFGAPHRRDRIWIAGWRDVLSHAEHEWIGRWEQQSQSLEETTNVVDSKSCGSRRNTGKLQTENEQQTSERQKERVRQSDHASQSNAKMANTSKYRIQSQSSETRKSSQWINSSGIGNSEWWAIEPDVGRVADGVAARVDRLKAIGNGQVSEVARRAWELLSDKG